MKLATIAITGTGSGFGWNLAEAALSREAEFISAGRSHHPKSTENIHCDLDEQGQGSLFEFGISIEHLDLLILNAYAFDSAQLSSDVTSEEMLRHFTQNVIGQRAILDQFLAKFTIEKVAVVSSGAAHKGYAGWLNYCVGKAAFDSLIRVYAEENLDTKFFSISPGVISTPMNRRLRESREASQFSWLEKLKSPRDAFSTAEAFLRLCLDSELQSGSWTAVE